MKFRLCFPYIVLYMINICFPFQLATSYPHPLLHSNYTTPCNSPSSSPHLPCFSRVRVPPRSHATPPSMPTPCCASPPPAAPRRCCPRPWSGEPRRHRSSADALPRSACTTSLRTNSLNAVHLSWPLAMCSPPHTVCSTRPRARRQLVFRYHRGRRVVPISNPCPRPRFITIARTARARLTASTCTPMTSLSSRSTRISPIGILRSCRWRGARATYRRSTSRCSASALAKSPRTGRRPIRCSPSGCSGKHLALARPPNGLPSGPSWTATWAFAPRRPASPGRAGRTRVMATVAARCTGCVTGGRCWSASRRGAAPAAHVRAPWHGIHAWRGTPPACSAWWTRVTGQSTRCGNASLDPPLIYRLFTVVQCAMIRSLWRTSPGRFYLYDLYLRLCVVHMFFPDYA